MTSITRRQALRNAGAAMAGAAVASSGIDDLLARAAAASPPHGRLKDIEHVVILIQENRSFDHYFGTLSGVRGFGDRRAHKTFLQRGVDGRTIHPFHLQSACLPDLTHDWGPQHLSWNHGKMNRFLFEHETEDVPSKYGSPQGTGVETMGYYRRSDLPFYYALADAFTICDAYHCSVIGPTDPNRLFSVSGTIDPAGKHGGPLVETISISKRQAAAGQFTWTTMPERLQAHGITWKAYVDTAGGGQFDHVLPYFKAFAPGSKLAKLGIEPTYPQDFMTDLASDSLPQVSWLAPGVAASEHPGYSGPGSGEVVARAIVEALIANPKVWRKTALFITWDENGGFFDHVAPPTAPPGTKGEYLTVASLPAAAQGIRGPIGLGFRVPMLVVSPFARGGLVCSDTFDHTSTLRFLETRFGVEVPNLSAWRRRVTGDLTSAFNFAARPKFGRPPLPAAATPSCSDYSMPPASTAGPFPKQERGHRRRPSGL
jgi:phospholipase C